MKKVSQSKIERIKELQKLISYHSKLYHELDSPELSDGVYDSLVLELKDLEGSTDETLGSLATKVGGEASKAFAKVTHRFRQWSFSNVFSFEELKEWESRLYRQLESEDVADQNLYYVAEHKIDGLKIILDYKNGQLVRAATRGDGMVGEDVTHTAKTIKDIPHKLKYPVDLICVGEVWLSESEFERINSERQRNSEPVFANPRNAAAGSLRQLDASITANRNLSTYIYDIDYFNPLKVDLVVPDTQWEELGLLKKLGLMVNKNNHLCKDLREIEKYYQSWSKKRDSLPYGVDGVVVKVDLIASQRLLGYTAKSPRFGTAYKFKAEQATTVVEDIQLQVGRTGTITPVAHLRPVLIDGSTVSRATLHNEGQIKRLDVRVGDTVVLQKAGDIIPEILQVIFELRPKKTKAFSFPKKVEGCGGDRKIERVPGEAAYRCVELDSDFLHRQRLYHFVSKQAFNIDGVGPKIIDALLEAGLINHHYDLFTLKAGDIKDLPGFKETSANNIVEAIGAAKKITLSRLLIALSIDQVGEETARLIAKRFGSLESIRVADQTEMAEIYGVGDIVAASIKSWFSKKYNQEPLEALLDHIDIEPEQVVSKNSVFKDKSMVFTGTLLYMSRDEAKDLVRQLGARVSNSVSGKTDYVIAGSEAGSKAEKAKDLGVKILSESEFNELLK